MDPTETKFPIDPSPTLIVEIPIKSLEIFATKTIEFSPS